MLLLHKRTKSKFHKNYSPESESYCCTFREWSESLKMLSHLKISVVISPSLAKKNDKDKIRQLYWPIPIP